MTIQECLDGQRWDSFVESIPWATPQHRFAWGETLASCFGYVQLAHRVFCQDDRVVAALPLARLSAGGPFRGIYSMVFDSYGGPLVHPEHLGDAELLASISAQIDSEASRHRAFEAQIMVPPTAPDAARECLLATGTRSFRRLCPLLALDRSLDEIRQGYDPAVRRAIRRSERAGVRVEANADHDLVRRGYAVYRATMDRIGGTTKPWRFIEMLLDKKLAVAFLAKEGDRLIGLVILLVSSQMAVYWISASEASASRSRPTNALVDAAIDWCHRNGIRQFSFGESPGERPGLVKFKLGWNPEPAYSTVVTRVYRPWIHRSWVALEPLARRAYAVWDRWKKSA